jgi:hypothetical protein
MEAEGYAASADEAWVRDAFLKIAAEWRRIAADAGASGERTVVPFPDSETPAP